MHDEGLGDYNELHGYLIRRTAATLANLGKHALGWEENLDGSPPPTLIIQWWRQRTHGDSAAREALRRGHRVIASPNSFTYLSFPTAPDEHFAEDRTSDLRKVYTATYDRSLSEHAVGTPGEFLGVECCCWTEYLTEELIEPMIFPRILACAEIMRGSPEERDYDAFVARVPAMEAAVRR